MKTLEQRLRFDLAKLISNISRLLYQWPVERPDLFSPEKFRFTAAPQEHPLIAVHGFGPEGIGFFGLLDLPSGFSGLPKSFLST